MGMSYPKKLGIVLLSIDLPAIFIVLYLIIIYQPPTTLRQEVGEYGAFVLSIFLLFLALIKFFELPREKVYVINGEYLKIITSLFRTKERIIPISNIEKAYVGLDTNYKYFIKQSETTEFLTTVIIFKDKGKRIMRFINQSDIVDFDKFIKALEDKGVEIIKIPFDVRSQKEFTEKIFQEEYKKCDRME